jgi:ferredoxin
VLNIGALLHTLIVGVGAAERALPAGRRHTNSEEANFRMTYVVCEPCVNCRYTDCALVCPVEAFHLDDTLLVINPETCIDCDACVPECPVEAIFPEDKVPEEWQSYTALNAEKSLSGLPIISEKLDPLC